jgi:hypothetical protein
VTALGGLGYTAMTHSETAIIAVVGGPQLAAAYALTRRGADLVRALIDVIGTATYGSFAHLVASADGARSVMVHRQITSLRLSLAVAAGGAYIAANASLVGVWVGPSFYLGLALTILIAVQMIVVGQGYLLNYLYRATGPVATGSWMLLSEALVRIPLMLLLFHAAGVIGIPIAGIVTGAAWAAMTITLTRRTLSPSDARHPLPDRALAAARLATLAAAAVIGSMVQEPSWLWAAGVGTAFAAVAFMILVILDPPLVSAISELRRPTSLVRLSPR